MPKGKAKAPTKRDNSTRKPRREPVWCKAFLQSIKLKANVTLAAEESGIDRTSAYEYRDKHPEFKVLWEAALDEGADRLEAEAWRRATQGTEKPVFYEGEVCGHIREYSDTLMCLLLKGHKPAKFRERISQELSGLIQTTQTVQIYLPEKRPVQPKTANLKRE